MTTALTRPGVPGGAVDLSRLATPFPAKDVEWRVQSCGVNSQGRIWAKVLAYIDNRAIMDRLDEVCGPGGWRNEFKPWPVGNGVLCGISIRIDGEWVEKWDGAENTDIEAVKGGLSSAMKRAAVQWGIGRYLYELEEGWAVIDDNGPHYGKTKEGKTFHWKPPALPSWALPPLHEPPPNDDRAANTLSPKEQDRARQANPRDVSPPCSPQQRANLIEASQVLGLTNQECNDVLRRNSVPRINQMTVRDAEKAELLFHQHAVRKLLAKHAVTLNDVNSRNPNVVADEPEELEIAEARTALVVLGAWEAEGVPV